MQPENDKAMSDSFVRHHYRVSHNDLNQYGIMHGGRLLTLSDEVGYLAAHAHAGMGCLTRGVHQALFHRPAKQGQTLLFEAQVALTGNTSIWVPIRVGHQGDGNVVMEAIIIFVDVDEEMHPQPGSRIRPGSESEQKLQARMQHIRGELLKGGR